MKQQATVSSIHEKRQRPGGHRTQETHRQDDFNRRLDAVVQDFLERTHEPADEDYAMRWAIARYVRTQSRSVKGEDHVAA